MARKFAAYRVTCTDAAGNVMPGAQVEVLEHTAGSPQAILYSDRFGQNGLTNPMTADAAGYVEFYTEGHAVQIIATLGGQTKTMNHVAVGTAAEYDASDLLFAFPLFFNASGLLAAGEVLAPIDIPLAMTLYSNNEDAEEDSLVGWYARLRTPPTNTFIVSLVSDDGEFGTITFQSGETEGTFDIPAELELLPGSQVWAVLPAVDPTADTITITLLARK